MKTNFKNKRAFTLIELLIVIAIIGILFIVLVSKVDFATDKAKATGVQTDFRSFQVALDTVAKENAGFNTFGFNAGDNAGAIPAGYAFVDENAKNATIGDGIRNSYDQGDKNLNGKQDVNGKDGYTGTTEVFTGRKIYTEEWTEVYTLTKPGTTGLDANAVFALESAINKNLDPKLHITINADGTIAMANQARDPWKNEYHGVYISNAERDHGADRGAIIIYSNGPNGKWGSAHDITNGVVTVTVPGNNTYGKDDYSIVSCYTFTNGYGEVLNMSTGFSNNQSFNGNTTNAPAVVPGGNGGNEPDVNEPIPVVTGATFNSVVSEDCNCQYLYHECLIPIEPVTLTWDELMLTENGKKYGYKAASISANSIGSYAFQCCRSLTSIRIPQDITSIGGWAFSGCINLIDLTIDANITTIEGNTFKYCENLVTVTLPDTLTEIKASAFYHCYQLTSITIPDSVTSIGGSAFLSCESLTNVVLGQNLETIGEEAFRSCYNLTQIVVPDSVTSIGERAFCNNYNLTNVVLGKGLQTISDGAFSLTNLSSITFPSGITSIGSSVFSECGGLQVYYENTVDKWNLIEKNSKWGHYSGNYAVYCTNGTVAADGTITYN